MSTKSRIVPWRGIVLDIHTAPTGGAPMVVADEVSAIAGRGPATGTTTRPASPAGSPGRSATSR